MRYFTTCPSPIGVLTLASEDDNLIGLWIQGQKYFGAGILRDMTENQNVPVFRATMDWLDRYFAQEKPAISELPLAPIGSPFRQMVWGILCQIPYGQVATYGDIAKQVAAKMGRGHMSGQAVGGAIGHNPIMIISPCHRVVGSTGSLVGYAGGIDRKIQLLELEGANMSGLFVPKKGTAL